jgi:hypothetical protein
LLGENVLEGVFELGKESRLIEELRLLEVSQTTLQLLLERSTMACNTAGHPVPMTAAV